MNSKQIKKVSRVIKYNRHEKLERSNSKGRKSDVHAYSFDQENDIFDAIPLEKLLRSKLRKSIYDVKEDDFFRIKKIR